MRKHKKISSYLTVNTHFPLYRAANKFCRINNQYFLWQSDETHKYSLWVNDIFYVKAGSIYNREHAYKG